MKLIAICLLLLLASTTGALGLGQDQLYTGTAATVPPGQFQFQLYGTTGFGKGSKVGGSSLTFGATDNVDVKLSYSYLWNYRGPDVQLGPNAGIKWRFAGDGRLKPSVSVSAHYANNETGLGRHRNDIGGLLIVQSSVGPLVFLGNFGRVWTGEDTPDARYVALALAKVMSPKLLTAMQYIELDPLGTGKKRTAWVAAVVHKPTLKTGFSVQLGYTPETVNNWSITLGVSQYF